MKARGIGSPGTGAKGGYELAEKGSENRTQVLVTAEPFLPHGLALKQLPKVSM